MRAFCAFASGFIKNFFGGGIEANPDDVCTGVLNLLQPVFVQKGGGDQCRNGHFRSLAADPGSHVDQVPVRPMILDLGDTNSADPFAFFQFPDFFCNQVGGKEGPCNTDEGIVLRSPGTFTGQPAVGAVGITSLGIVLEKVDAVAAAARYLTRFESQFDGRSHADSHIIRTDLIFFG